MSTHDAVIQLFRSAMDALDREDWSAAADLCDPVSLDRFRRDALASFDRRGIQPEDITEDELMRRSPHLPRAVAEYHATRMREITDPERRLRDQFPGVRTVEELRSLNARGLFAAFLEGRSGRQVHTGGEVHFARRLAERWRGERTDAHRHVVIGVLPDGDRIAHLLYRIKLEPKDSWVEDGSWDPDDDDPELDLIEESMDRVDDWKQDSPAWFDDGFDADADSLDFELLPEDEQRLALDLIEYSHPQSVLCRRQPDGRWALIADDNFLGLGGVIVGVVTCEVGPDEGEGQSTEADDPES